MSDRAEALFGKGTALASARDYAAAQRCLEDALTEDYRRALTTTILERNAVLYEDRRVAEFQRFFESALRAKTL
jgi:hypothetical protein